MKLKKILIEQEMDADATSAIILLFDKLSKVPSYQDAIGKLSTPMDKFVAVQKFAETLGIPNNKFNSFVQNMNNKSMEQQ